MYGITPDIRAKITLTGRDFVCSGYRPVHKIDGINYLTTGVHEYIDRAGLNRNETVEGNIIFISPEEYPHTMRVGMNIPFYEGERLIGIAEVVEIYTELLKA